MAARKPHIELLHLDCMEYMRTLPDKAFDLAIVDPPYGIDALIRNGTCKMNQRMKAGSWIDIAPGPEYFSEVLRVTAHQIVWGGNYFSEHLAPTRSWVYWSKGKPDVCNYSDGELAWTSFDQRMREVRIVSHGFMREQDVIHPTQKPVALYRWLLKNYAKPGQRILDTHLGSGSIAIACDLEGFDLVGCEIDADYIAGARKRLADHQAQPRLFDMPRPTAEQLSLDTNTDEAEAA